MEAVRIHQVTFRENETFLKSFSDGPKRDKGQLFLHVDLPDNPGAEDALAEKIWRALHDSFFNCQADEPSYCFEEALKAANEVIDQENKKREAGTIGRMHAVAALLQDDTLHFAQTGDGSIILTRGEYLTVVSDDGEAGSSATEGSFSTVSSGSLLAEDVVAFCTRSLPFGEEDLLEVFSHKPAKIASQLKALSKQKELTGLISFWSLPAVFSSIPLEETPEPEEEKVDEAMATETSEEELSTGSKKKKGSSKASEAMKNLSQKFKGEKIDKAKETMKGLMGGLGSKFSRVIKRPESIKNVNRRYILLSIVALVVVLGVLFTYQSRYNEQAAQAEFYENLLSQVRMNIETAEQRFLIGEKQDATELLNKANSSIQQIETAGFFQSDVDKIKKEIELHRDNFDAIFRVENPSVFADLSQKGTVDALGIINTQDQRNFIYEPRRLFETLLDKVQEPLQIDQEEIVIAGAELEDFNVLSFITQSGQVIEYEVRNGRFEVATTQDDTWKKAIDIKTFNGEFIYLLDPSSNTIWKYRRLRNGYSTGSNYNTEGDLSDAVSLAIDGDIYVLMRDGNIIRFRRGEILAYDIKSQPSIPLKNPSRIFTLPEANNIYVLDSANRRIVVYSKGSSGVGQYQKQVVFDSLAPNEIRDFYIDKDEQKLTVLTADKVYITDL